MFDKRLLDKTCTVIVVTLLYGCQISVLSALSLDFIKYKLKRSNADSFHHHLAYLPNRKLYPNIRCRCGLDTVHPWLRRSVPVKFCDHGCKGKAVMRRKPFPEINALWPWPLTLKSIGHILASWRVFMWSFMMIGVKGNQLCAGNHFQ